MISIMKIEKPQAVNHIQVIRRLWFFMLGGKPRIALESDWYAVAVDLFLKWLFLGFSSFLQITNDLLQVCDFRFCQVADLHIASIIQPQ